MAEFLKPQSPIRYKKDDAFIYPLTTADQVILEDNTRLNATLDQVVYAGETVDSTVVPINADTLGGRPADEYATENFVSTKIAEAQLSGGESGSIDLSGYATKDDISNATADLQTELDELAGTVKGGNNHDGVPVLSDTADNWVASGWPMVLLNPASGASIFPVTTIDSIQDMNTEKYLSEILEEKDRAIQKAAPRNLLDNSDFRNPVNQRGKTTYNGSVYTIDRWKLWNEAGDGILTVNSGYVAIQNANLFQYVEGIDTNAIYTFAVKYVGEEPKVVSGTFAAGAGSPAAAASFGTPAGRSSEVRIYTGRSLEWAALYEGEYTAETLPKYQPKGYGAELAECMRYFYTITAPGSAAPIWFGYNYTTSLARFIVQHPVPMRVSPTFSYVKGTSLEIIQNNTIIDVSDLTVNANRKDHILLFAAATGLTQRAICGLNAAGSTFTFSADL